MICAPPTLDNWFDEEEKEDQEYFIIDIPYKVTKKETFDGVIWSLIYKYIKLK